MDDEKATHSPSLCFTTENPHLGDTFVSQYCMAKEEECPSLVAINNVRLVKQNIFSCTWNNVAHMFEPPMYVLIKVIFILCKLLHGIPCVFLWVGMSQSMPQIANVVNSTKCPKHRILPLLIYEQRYIFHH